MSNPQRRFSAACLQVTEVGLGALLARGLVNVDVTGCRGLRRETKAAASIGLPALRSQLQRAGFIHRSA
jgi:hypothetical protein